MYMNWSDIDETYVTLLAARDDYMLPFAHLM